MQQENSCSLKALGGWERLDAVGKVLQIAGLEGSGTLDFPTDGSISDGAPLAAASGAVSGDRCIFRSGIYWGGKRLFLNSSG